MIESAMMFEKPSSASLVVSVIVSCPCLGYSHTAFCTGGSRQMRVEAAEQMFQAARWLSLGSCVNSDYPEQPRTPILDMDHR
jgi:hypothetical protein